MTENKKYELADETKEWCGYTLHRIRALKDFSTVKAGDLGGWIESEYNLSQEGDCWIYDNAIVCEDAKVYGNARVCWDAEVYGNAEVCGDARVYGDAIVCGDAKVCWNTDYTAVRGFGREQRVTTFYRLKDGDIGVTCGCFHGTIKQFRDKVKKTHGDSKYAKEYLMIADLMELHFGEENKI